MKTTAKQVEACIQVARIMADAIKESGSRGIPSGHLYAALMGKLNLDQYNSLLGILKRSGLVSEENFLLKYTGN